jgi:RNA polymerase primary sigma factor
MADPDMTSIVLTGKFQTLLEKGEEQGYLTLEDLMEVDEGVMDDAGKRSALVRQLTEQGVKVVIFDKLLARIDGESEELVEEQHLFDLDNIAIDDSISLYLREMAVVPLLNIEEEVDLAKRMEQASFARRELARADGNLDDNTRRELEALIQDGFRAREKLIKANTRLVVSIARRYTGRGVPLLDLIQEGNVGLMRAVEKFEYQRGFRFSTYATWWIRQSISRAVAYQGRTIRVPVHMFDRLRRLYKVSREFEQAHGRLPTPEELAEHLEVDVDKVLWMLRVAQKPLSLESPVGEDEDSELGMLVEDNSAPSPAQVTYQNMLSERVEEVLSTLSPKEARILRLRFGLGHDRAYTLEEVGRKFGLTRERIRQIEQEALQRLRHPSRSDNIRCFLENC